MNSGFANEWNYIIAAYVVTWAVILVYTGHVHKAARRAREAFRRAGETTGGFDA